MSTRRLHAPVALAALLGACGGRASVSDAETHCASGCDPSSDGGGSPVTSSAGGSTTTIPDAGVDAGGKADSSRGGALGVAGAVNAAGSDSGAPSEGGASEAGAPNMAGACTGSGARFITGVVDYSFGGGQNHGQADLFPEAIFGPPVANDPGSVVSLGNGGWVVVVFAGNAIVDGPGVDFTVFENPLATFHELATVAVSDDALHWTEFPCTAAQEGPDFGYCAGVGVVNSSPSNGIDPLDPRVSGGDLYDLADIGVRRARYVRITDRVDLIGLAGVFDLDAVAIVNPECP